MALITSVKRFNGGLLAGMTAHGSQNTEYSSFSNPNDIAIIPGTVAFVNIADPLVVVEADSSDADVRPVGIYSRQQDISTDNATQTVWGALPVGSINHRQPIVMTAGSIVVRTEEDLAPAMFSNPFYRVAANGAGKLVKGALRGDSDTGNAIQMFELRVIDFLDTDEDEGLAVVSFLWKLI